MDSKPQVTLPPELIDMSWAWARQVVADYAAGHNANSRAVTCFDAHSNTDLQAKAKMSECAFALWVDCDPKKALHWGRTCDNGSDVFWRGKRWDVKATQTKSRYLLWPIGKNDIYKDKKFDVLVLVKHDLPRFQISGWVSKSEFYEKKKVAERGHVLVLGTWHMHEDDLWGMELLKDYDGQKDHHDSYYECIRDVRERVAAGGPGWQPK